MLLGEVVLPCPVLPVLTTKDPCTNRVMRVSFKGTVTQKNRSNFIFLVIISNIFSLLVSFFSFGLLVFVRVV